MRGREDEMEKNRKVTDYIKDKSKVDLFSCETKLVKFMYFFDLNKSTDFFRLKNHSI